MNATWAMSDGTAHQLRVPQIARFDSGNSTMYHLEQRCQGWCCYHRIQCRRFSHSFPASHSLDHSFAAVSMLSGLGSRLQIPQWSGSTK